MGRRIQAVSSLNSCMCNSRECQYTLVRGLFIIDTMEESVSKIPLRNFVGTLSIEQVEHLMWDTVCCKTTGKRVQSSRAEFSDITDESQLRGKSGVLCFSFLFFVTFWQRRMPKPPPSLRECGCVYCCIQVMWENLLEHFSSDRAFKLKV